MDDEDYVIYKSIDNCIQSTEILLTDQDIEDELDLICKSQSLNKPKYTFVEEPNEMFHSFSCICDIEGFDNMKLSGTIRKETKRKVAREMLNRVKESCAKEVFANYCQKNGHDFVDSLTVVSMNGTFKATAGIEYQIVDAEGCLEEEALNKAASRWINKYEPHLWTSLMPRDNSLLSEVTTVLNASQEDLFDVKPQKCENILNEPKLSSKNKPFQNKSQKQKNEIIKFSTAFSDSSAESNSSSDRKPNKITNYFTFKNINKKIGLDWNDSFPLKCSTPKVTEISCSKFEDKFTNHDENAIYNVVELGKEKNIFRNFKSVFDNTLVQNDHKMEKNADNVTSHDEDREVRMHDNLENSTEIESSKEALKFITLRRSPRKKQKMDDFDCKTYSLTQEDDSKCQELEKNENLLDTQENTIIKNSPEKETAFQNFNIKQSPTKLKCSPEKSKSERFPSYDDHKISIENSELQKEILRKKYQPIFDHNIFSDFDQESENYESETIISPTAISKQSPRASKNLSTKIPKKISLGVTTFSHHSSQSESEAFSNENLNLDTKELGDCGPAPPQSPTFPPRRSPRMKLKSKDSEISYPSLEKCDSNSERFKFSISASVPKKHTNDPFSSEISTASLGEENEDESDKSKECHYMKISKKQKNNQKSKNKTNKKNLSKIKTKKSKEKSENKLGSLGNLSSCFDVSEPKQKKLTDWIHVSTGKKPRQGKSAADVLTRKKEVISKKKEMTAKEDTVKKDAKKKTSIKRPKAVMTPKIKSKEEVEKKNSPTIDDLLSNKACEEDRAFYDEINNLVEEMKENKKNERKIKRQKEKDEMERKEREEKFLRENNANCERLQALTEDELKEIFENNMGFMQDFWDEKIESTRRKEFYANAGTRNALLYKLITHPFTDSQISYVLKLIQQRWMKSNEERMKQDDFVWKVFLPELFIKIYMDLFNYSKSDAENRINRTPL